MSTKRILVIGATGVVGRKASIHFLQQQLLVRCLVRSRDKADDLEKGGAEIMVRDLTQKGWDSEVFKNVDVVITAAHSIMGNHKNSSKKVDLIAHKEMIDGALRENVKHFIYTSSMMASPDHPVDFIRYKYDVEQHLVNSGLNYTILRLPAFMEWHVHNLLGKSIAGKNKALIFGKGENKTNFIGADDVVKVMNSIINGDLSVRQVLKVGGPENISKNEIVKIYADFLKSKPSISHVPTAVLLPFSSLIKPFHPGIAQIMKFSAWEDKTDQTMEANSSVAQFGLEPVRLREFIRGALQG